MLELLWILLLIIGPIIYMKGRSMEKQLEKESFISYEILDNGEVYNSKEGYGINEYSDTILGEYR